MTATPARPLPGLAHRTAKRFVFMVGLMMSFHAPAQDTDSGDCTANGTTAEEACKALTDPTTQQIAIPGAAELDWVPLESIAPESRDAQCINCGGSYVDPLAGADTSQAPEASQIEAVAKSTELRGSEVLLQGGVEVEQGYRRLRGDSALIDRDQHSATVTGNIVLREPGILLRGDRAQIFSKSGEATIEAGQYVFHDRHMRGNADMLERDSDGLIHVHEGNITYCAPGDKDWAIRADKLKLDLEEGLGIAEGARLDVGGIPIFYTPWMQFPLDDRRRTGFLWPDIGNDSSGGLDIAAPIYFNLAPNYDALYAPRYIEERGINHDLTLRYLNPLVGLWSVGGSYMSSDDRYKDQIPEGKSDDRWLGVIKQNGLFQKRWRSRVDYSKASDVDYLRDLEISSLDTQRETSLLQLASLDYLGDSWLFDLDLQQFQSLADDINEDYKKLPQFTGQYRGRGTPFRVEPVFLAQYSNFDSDEDRVTGQRVYAEAGATYPMLWTYGFLRPTMKYRQINYDLSDGRFFTDDSPSAGAGLASIDGGLVFERDASFAEKGLVQTLEPRLYYLYSEYEEQIDQPDFDSAELTFSYNQLFRETRFSGRDRLDDANQLAVGVTSNFIEPETGKRLLSASIGQIFYFRDRKVRLLPFDEPLDESGSEIAGELSFTPVNNFWLRSNLIWDPYSGNMNSGHFLASYTPDNGSIFNLGYSYRRPLTTINTQDVTEEASFSAYFPVYRNWRLFGAIDYSMKGNTSVQDMVGVEYDNCCWTVRLLHLRYYDNFSGDVPDFDNPDLEREHSTQVQIILKGMGGFGNRITSLMEDMIRGYKEREY